MSEELIEAVAKAIFDSLYGDTHTGGWTYGEEKGVTADEDQRERFRKMARAAIAACEAAS